MINLKFSTLTNLRDELNKHQAKFWLLSLGRKSGNGRRAKQKKLGLANLPDLNQNRFSLS